MNFYFESQNQKMNYVYISKKEQILLGTFSLIKKLFIGKIFLFNIMRDILKKFNFELFIFHVFSPLSQNHKFHCLNSNQQSPPFTKHSPSNERVDATQHWS